MKPWTSDELVKTLRRIAGRLSNARHEAGRIAGAAAISNPDAIRAVELGTLRAEAENAATDLEHVIAVYLTPTRGRRRHR